MSAQQLHLPPVPGPLPFRTLCLSAFQTFVGATVSMILKAAPVQVVVELKAEHVPIPLGYADPLIWLHVPGEVLRTQDPVEAEELILFLDGDLWVISFPLGSSPS